MIDEIGQTLVKLLNLGLFKLTISPDITEFSNIKSLQDLLPFVNSIFLFTFVKSKNKLSQVLLQ